MGGFQFRSSLKKCPARKASGPERHPFDSAEPIIPYLHPESGCFADWFLGKSLLFQLLPGMMQCVKRGPAGNTRLLPPPKMLLVPMNFFSSG